MTEYELEDLLTGSSLASLETFGMYVTVLIAYLVASYMVGKRLSTIQISTISFLFLLSSSIVTWGTYAYLSRSIPLAERLS